MKEKTKISFGDLHERLLSADIQVLVLNKRYALFFDISQKKYNNKIGIFSLVGIQKR